MRWVIAILVVGIVAAAVVGFGPGTWGTSIGSPGGRPTAATTVGSDEAAQRVFAAGVIEGSDREALLDFEVEGRLAELFVSEGTEVRKGDELARLDDALLRRKLAEAEGELALAQAEYERLVNGASPEARRVAQAQAELAAGQLEHADSSWARAQQLQNDNAITKEKLDSAKFGHKYAESNYAVVKSRLEEIEAPARSDDLKIAIARSQIAEAAVEHAREMLNKSILRAPADGMVLSVTAELGELLGPGRSEPLITMANPSVMHARAYVEELDALSVQVGEKAIVTTDGRADHKYSGCVTWIAPSMTDKRHRHHKPGERLDVKVREVLILVDDPADLVIGLPVDVFIESQPAAAQPEAISMAGPEAGAPPSAPSVPAEN